MLTPGCRRTLRVLLVLCSFVTCAQARDCSSQVDYSTPANVRRFADYLYEEGDYLGAAGEYQRCAFALGQGGAGVDSLYYRIGICYRLGRRPSESVNFFLRMTREFPQSGLADMAYCQAAYSQTLSGKYEESLSFARANRDRLSSQTARARLDAVTALNYLYQRRWDSARNLMASSETDGEPDTLRAFLFDVAEEGRHLPRKSTFRAGVLSALIPGLGKVYCGRIVDGLFSLAVTGITAWQAQRAIDDHGASSAESWIYGGLSGGLYLGNVYGSAVAARIYNDSLERNLLQRADPVVETLFR